MDETESTFDPANRRLCPDGACVGIIGEDGRCNVCGRSAAEDGEVGGASGPDDEGADRGDDDVKGEPAGGDAPAFDPSTRRLCPDGACVGVLGPEGVCPVCGRKGD